MEINCKYPFIKYLKLNIYSLNPIEKIVNKILFKNLIHIEITLCDSIKPSSCKLLGDVFGDRITSIKICDSKIDSIDFLDKFQSLKNIIISNCCCDQFSVSPLKLNNVKLIEMKSMCSVVYEGIMSVCEPQIKSIHGKFQCGN